MRRLTPDRAAELVERYVAGEETVALAQHFGIDRITVYHALENAGVERRKRRISREARAEAVRFHEQGMAVGKIAARIGYSYAGTYMMLKREGVELPVRRRRLL